MMEFARNMCKLVDMFNLLVGLLKLEFKLTCSWPDLFITRQGSETREPTTAV